MVSMNPKGMNRVSRRNLLSTTKRSPWLTGISLLLLASFLLASSGCTIRLVSEYDKEFDRSITQLQKKSELFLTRLENTVGEPASSYQNNKKFYREVEAELNTLFVRAQAKPRNELTVDHLKELRTLYGKLEKFHQKKDQDIKPKYINQIRRSLQRQFRGILKFELKKKRGDES